MTRRMPKVNIDTRIRTGIYESTRRAMYMYMEPNLHSGATASWLVVRGDAETQYAVEEPGADRRDLVRRQAQRRQLRIGHAFDAWLSAQIAGHLARQPHQDVLTH